MVNILPWLRYFGLAEPGSPAERCTELASLRLGGSASIQTAYLAAGDNFTVPGSCALGLPGNAPYQVQMKEDICRVYISCNTSKSSTLRLEASVRQ